MPVPYHEFAYKSRLGRTMESLAWLYGVDCLVLGSISFAMYGIDKSRSQQRGKRIPERTLHRIDLVGWAVGSGVVVSATRLATATF